MLQVIRELNRHKIRYLPPLQASFFTDDFKDQYFLTSGSLCHALLSGSIIGIFGWRH